MDLFLRPDEEPELTVRLGLAGPTAPGLLADSQPRALQRVGASLAATADLLPGTRAAAVGEGRVQRGSPISAWLPIIYGCDKTCTYCIVPFSRGPERSRPFDDVVDEARSLAAAGYREVTLLGQNVNSYGHDLPPDARFAEVHEARSLGRRLDLDGRPDMAALLRAIDALAHRRRRTRHLARALRYLASVGPVRSADLGHGRVPVGVRAPAPADPVGRRRRAAPDGPPVHDRGVPGAGRASCARPFPGISLTTDVIVGFCGETEEQFERTLELLRTVRFEQVFAAAFSPRPGTPAARLPDDVPRAEKKRRLQALLALQEDIGLAANQAGLARRPRSSSTRSGPFRPTAIDGDVPAARVCGRNRNNKLVHLDGGPELIGQLVNVRIERAGPYALSGTVANA